MLQFASPKIDLKKRYDLFAGLAARHVFRQALPLLLVQELKTADLKHLRSIVSDIIAARAGLPAGPLLAEDGGRLVKDRLRQLVQDNVGNVVELGDGAFTDLTAQLTAALYTILKRSGFADQIGIIQRFPNIRVKVGPYSAEQEHASHPLSTSKMHCDVWAGAPQELQICILELLNIGHGPKIEFGEVKAFPRSLAKKLKGYEDPAALKFLKNNLTRTLLSTEGSLHILDAYTPHRTIYPGDGLRVSVDFRIALKEALSPAVIIQKIKSNEFCAPESWAAPVSYRAEEPVAEMALA